MPIRSLRAVVAVDENWGIGKRSTNKMCWHLPPDLSEFSRLTTHTERTGAMNAVIMGRRTWMSLPPRMRPLPGRVNVVLSSTWSAHMREHGCLPPSASTGSPDAQPREPPVFPPHVVLAASWDEAMARLEHMPAVETVFAMGGACVYEACLKDDRCDTVHITRVGTRADCDVHFPVLTEGAYRAMYRKAYAGRRSTHKTSGLAYQFETYVRRRNEGDNSSQTADERKTYNPANNVVDGVSVPCPVVRAPAAAEAHPEMQYLNLIRRVIETGASRGDRTGVGTRSVFHAHMCFPLHDTFPLFTTKRVYWKGVVEELLWMIRGETDAKALAARGVHIWDANGSREFLDKCGFAGREEGDLGPVYGFQWRHFGAPYGSCHDDYTGQGVDQLAGVIRAIRTNPTSRRIVMSAWNASAIASMALPPCHVMCQFYVQDGALSCQMYQRSADLGLGVPFNVASYSLLTCMLAHHCGLAPGVFHHVIGDAHVYNNHIDALRKQLERTPKPFPRVRVSAPPDRALSEYSSGDIVLVGYKSHPRIKMEMAV